METVKFWTIHFWFLHHHAAARSEEDDLPRLHHSKKKVPAFRKGKRVCMSLLATPSPTRGITSRKEAGQGKHFWEKAPMTGQGTGPFDLDPRNTLQSALGHGKTHEARVFVCVSQTHAIPCSRSAVSFPDLNERGLTPPRAGSSGSNDATK
ncbi:hypothetical protein [uncultured Tateyamaria sp.]|uniref:hypothetical protein n=1 Tax=uncultured Tateyamaria sp. TaxID=455651 RepID=UPI002638C7A6|nr:hypothetical protein [uncultured Tateyamaria sp.]